VAAITKEATGMAAVGGPDMSGAGRVVIILIGAILIGAGAAVTGAAGAAVTGGAGAALTGGAGVVVTGGAGVAVTGASRIRLTRITASDYQYREYENRRGILKTGSGCFCVSIVWCRLPAAGVLKMELVRRHPHHLLGRERNPVPELDKIPVLDLPAANVR
jgi:hypothetical protein